MGITSLMTKKIDKALILSDIFICSVLSKEAEALGVTLEEYVDRFLDAFYDEPSEFNTIIQQ